MSKLNTLQKVKLIVELCDKHNITAYEIAKNTDLTPSGVQRILNNEVTKPRDSTLNQILQFIEEKLFTSTPDDQPPETYFQDLKQFAMDIIEHEEELLTEPLFKYWLETKVQEEVIRRLKDMM